MELDDESATTSLFPSPSRSKRTGEERLSDLIKYSLATSSLLATRLVDALPLYPAAPPAIDHCTIQEPKLSIEWELGWETKGDKWCDHELFHALLLSYTLVITFLSTLYQRFRRLSQLESIPPELTTDSEEAIVDQSVDLIPTSQTELFVTVERLILSSQTLDKTLFRAFDHLLEADSIESSLGVYVLASYLVCRQQS